MKKAISLFAITLNLIFTFSLNAQNVHELNLNGNKYPVKTNGGNQTWKAWWITNPDILMNEHSVILFRKSFELSSKPDNFIIHVSADNKYELYVNGKFICMGPARGDLTHYRYETIDIGSFLNTGKNVIAARVINFGQERMHAWCSAKTGFILQGYSDKESVVNSEDKTWKTLHVKQHGVNTVKPAWYKDFGKPYEIIRGWYAGNPLDSIIGIGYPWGWKETNYNDSDWKKAKWLSGVTNRYSSGHSPWLMVPRTVELLEHKEERLGIIRKAEGITLEKDAFKQKGDITIPANKKVTILLDQKHMTIGYPILTVSKGKNASIRLRYAETLFNDDGLAKNRNEVEGKMFVGYDDYFLADGGDNREFMTTWIRPFRYMMLEIETKDEDLIINDLHNLFTHYPAKQIADFNADDPKIHDIWEICCRTNDICAQDYFMSDAYYETMQYLADTRIHAIDYYFQTGDDKLYRNAIELFDNSRIPDGLTLAAYPGEWHWIIPFFSMIWTNMINDYYMISGDKEFALKYKNGVQILFNWFDDHIGENGLLQNMEWANPNHPNHNSAFFTLAFAYSMNNIANTWADIGLTEEAKKYTERADYITKKVYENCWDESRQLMAETPNKKKFKGSTQFMTVLTNAIPKKQQKVFFAKAVEELGQGGSHEQFYFNQALKASGNSELYVKYLEPYRQMLDEGLTTTKENLVDAVRSDCHPWTTSPIYYDFHTLCGITPVKAGYTEVNIAPELCSLNNINAKCPTQLGLLILDLEKKGKTGITGTINIPKGMKATFEWNGQKIELKEGEQKVFLK